MDSRKAEERSRRTWLFLLADTAGEGTKGVDRDGSLHVPGWHGRDLSHGRSHTDGQGGFFGSTTQGGTGTCPILFDQGGCGTVFHVAPPEQGQTAWTEAILYSFQGGTDGNEPAARLLMDPKTAVLYGMTYLGGAYGAGTVFAIAPPGLGQTNWTESVLHTFTGGSDGGYPFASLIEDANGVFYGTISVVGIYGYGAAFTLTPPAQGETNWTENVIHNFGG